MQCISQNTHIMTLLPSVVSEAWFDNDVEFVFDNWGRQRCYIISHLTCASILLYVAACLSQFYQNLICKKNILIKPLRCIDAIRYFSLISSALTDLKDICKLCIKLHVFIFWLMNKVNVPEWMFGMVMKVISVSVTTWGCKIYTHEKPLKQLFFVPPCCT